MNILGEFDQAEFEKIVEREKREAVEMAEAKGWASLLSELISSGDLTRERAAELLGVDVSELDDALER